AAGAAAATEAAVAATATVAAAPLMILGLASLAWFQASEPLQPMTDNPPMGSITVGSAESENIFDLFPGPISIPTTGAAPISTGTIAPTMEMSKPAERGEVNVVEQARPQSARSGETMITWTVTAGQIYRQNVWQPGKGLDGVGDVIVVPTSKPIVIETLEAMEDKQMFNPMTVTQRGEGMQIQPNAMGMGRATSMVAAQIAAVDELRAGMIFTASDRGCTATVVCR
ncbi:MAG: hypothetical protein ABIH41_04740, partial [Nanoarchaeota archaeon]